jgi:uncharacterized protein YkwD
MSILLRKVRGSAVAFVLCAVSASCVIELPLEPVDRSVSLSSINVFEFVQRTNRIREEAGLAPLEWSDPLSRAAVLHARQMADAGLMAHELPQASLPTLSSRVVAVGYRFTRLTENIAWGYPSVERVMMGWMNSPSHRENILSAEIVDIGVGVAVTPEGIPYYANLYGRSEP